MSQEEIPDDGDIALDPSKPSDPIPSVSWCRWQLILFYSCSVWPTIDTIPSVANYTKQLQIPDFLLTFLTRRIYIHLRTISFIPILLRIPQLHRCIYFAAFKRLGVRTIRDKIHNFVY
jgi:hypothetical protein